MFGIGEGSGAVFIRRHEAAASLALAAAVLMIAVGMMIPIRQGFSLDSSGYGISAPESAARAGK